MSKEHQAYDLQTNIQEVLTVMQTGGDGGEGGNTFTDEEERETIHVYPVEGGGILLTRTPILDDEDLDTTPLSPQPAQQPAPNAAIGTLLFGLFMVLSCLMFQFFILLNPFTVTITLAARSQQLSLRGTLQLGRVLNPITLSQSQTTPTTGHGHQDAKSATGSITFYNGQLQSVFVPAGTLLTGNDGEQVETSQDATVPAESQSIPPALGLATVSAHAVIAGAQGNIATGDINQGCCATAIKAVNTASFSGGQDERDFQTVAKSDITSTEAPLKATLAQSVQGALQGQLKNNEGVVMPSCTTSTTSDHRPGEEAAAVKVTVSETCSGVAYNSQQLEASVTLLLLTQATKKLGAGYSLLSDPHITVTGAASAKQVTLSFTSVSTWVYALSSAEQNHIKKLIAGKTTEKALQLLLSLPGIERVSLQSSGFGDAARLPKDPRTIHLLLIYGI